MDLARRAEEWGYNRYWLAEHHNIEGVASSATAVLIGHIAGGTKKSASVLGYYVAESFFTCDRGAIRNP